MLLILQFSNGRGYFYPRASSSLGSKYYFDHQGILVWDKSPDEFLRKLPKCSISSISEACTVNLSLV